MTIGAVCVLIMIVLCHCFVVWNASGKTYDNVDDVTHNKIGLLLATSPITPEGAHNFNFDNRIKDADELYKAGKIDFIIASGGDYTQTQITPKPKRMAAMNHRLSSIPWLPEAYRHKE